jgi:hypothetical protein
MRPGSLMAMGLDCVAMRRDYARRLS